MVILTSSLFGIHPFSNLEVVWRRETLRRLIFLFALISISSAAWAFDTAQEAYNRRDYAAAFALWQPRATAGDPEAQTALGSLFAYGRGLAKNDDEAVLWFRKAAEQDFAAGQFALGAMYLQGRGVPADADQAALWIQKARRARSNDSPVLSRWNV
jgi:TPR repeat protein